MGQIVGQQNPPITITTEENEVLISLTESDPINLTVIDPAPISVTLTDGVFNFLGLNDTPSSYSGQSGLYLRVNSGESGIEFSSVVQGGGSSTFLGLSDTPNDFSSQSLKAVRVNSGETALEFYNPDNGSSDTNSGVWGSITGNISNQSDLQSLLSQKSNTGHMHNLSDVSGVSGLAYLDGSNQPFTGPIFINTDSEVMLDLTSSTDSAINIRTPSATTSSFYFYGGGTQFAEIDADHDLGTIELATTPSGTHIKLRARGTNVMELDNQANDGIRFPELTTNGFLKTSFGSGTLVVDTTDYQEQLSFGGEEQIPYMSDLNDFNYSSSFLFNGTDFYLQADNARRYLGAGNDVYDYFDGADYNVIGTGNWNISGFTKVDSQVNIESPAFITDGGTSSQFVKGDGSLDSGSYITGLGLFTTDDLAEGSNLYYTEARVSANTDVALNTASRHDPITVLDSSEIDFTLSGQQITASLITGSIGETKLSPSINISLGFADSSLQSGDNISELTNDAGYITGAGWGQITGILSDQTDLQSALDDKLSVSSATGTYLELDTSNGPLTGNLEIEKADPELRLTDSGNSEYTRIIKADSSNQAIRYNRVNAPQSGASVVFDGTTDYINIGKPAEIDIIHQTTDWSISFWVNANAASATRQGIFGSTTASSERGFAIRLNSGAVQFLFSNGGGYTYSSLVGGFSSGSWMHYVVTCTSSSVVIYRNNSSAATGTLSGTSAGAATNNCYVGGIGQKGSSETLFGMVDELVVFDRGLTVAEVSDLYNGGSGLYATLAGTFPSTSAVIGDALTAGFHFDGNAEDFSTAGNDGTLFGNTTFDTVNFVVSAESLASEIIIWKSEDGTEVDEFGKQTFGDENGRTIIEGQSIRINSQGIEIFSINTDGELVFPDDYEFFLGTGKDVGNSFDGTNLNTSGSGNWNITGFDNLVIAAGVKFNERVYTNSTTVTTTSHTAGDEHIILVDDDTAGSAVTVTLPAASGNAGLQYIIKKIGSTANVIIDGDSAEEIDGATTATLTTQYESITVVGDGSSWHII